MARNQLTKPQLFIQQEQGHKRAIHYSNLNFNYQISVSKFLYLMLTLKYLTNATNKCTMYIPNCWLPANLYQVETV